MTDKTSGFVVVAPATPGAIPTEQGEFSTLSAARREAMKYNARKDLRTMDVWIMRCVGRKNGSRDNPDGRERQFVENGFLPSRG